MKKLLIVDDTLFIRETIKRMLEDAELDVEIVGEADNGEDAIALYREKRPDLVTMDITMPNKNGLDATKEICTEFPDAKIIMITAVGQQKMSLQHLKTVRRIS